MMAIGGLIILIVGCYGALLCGTYFQTIESMIIGFLVGAVPMSVIWHLPIKKKKINYNTKGSE